MAAAAAPPAKSGNALTRKMGPLPAWAWIAIVGAVILLWAWYEHSKSSAATSSAATTPTTDTSSSTGSTNTSGSSGSGSTPAAPVQTTPPEQGTPVQASPQYATTAQLQAFETQQAANNEQQGDRLTGQEKQIMRRSVAPGKGIGKKKAPAKKAAPAVKKTPVQHHSRTHTAAKKK